MYKFIPEISIDDIIRAMEEKHSVVYKSAIKKAANYAQEKHKDVFRKSGEPYIYHPLRVAFSIASWGLESEAVIAALLHDVVEDCEDVTTETITKTFNLRIANLVDSVTSVDKAITDAEKKKLTKADIDNMSDAKLIANMNRTALLIKIADRLDNLSTIACFPISQQIKKARDTREILIPIAARAGAFELIDELENLCIMIEHHDRYTSIAEAYNKILIHNVASTEMFLSIFKTLVESLSGISDNSLSKTILNESKGTGLSKAIKGIDYKKRSISSLYRQVVKESDNYRAMRVKAADSGASTNWVFPPVVSLDKGNTASYDITLIVSDDYVDTRENFDINDIFFLLYDKFMINNGVEICSVNYTTHGNSSFILIKDEMGNLYRVFVRSEFDYLRFKIGDIVDGMDEFNFRVDEDNPKKSFVPKIKVYKRDGSAMYIEEGATVLDFAFAIHTDIGLHFQYANIDGDPSELPPYTPLSEGDLVYIKHSADVVPSIKWFKYVKTSNATEKLVKALSSIYNIPTS